ncbi:hypothetical protein EXIGLDRAFT_716967 [Exidia glandulosa HHB12029]|uniref:Uncharacterized protein n=1 Tax=Exidia glandulosa HHB12029 TaxID=1314781 RepID=A0A165IMA2_EXIGL|nr:hypothetical protein EXIGLDRAFT_716967 [Exidia glandulosa HHB12029]
MSASQRKCMRRVTGEEDLPVVTEREMFCEPNVRGNASRRTASERAPSYAHRAAPACSASEAARARLHETE